MTAPQLDRRQEWIIDGDPGSTLALLTLQLAIGDLDAIGQIRAVWWLRRFAVECDSPDLTQSLLDTLDPGGSTPSPMTIVELRFWLRTRLANAPWGALTRLAEAAGINKADPSKLIAGSSLSPDKCERLAAAIIAAGRARL
jgi:hypothetical protein